MLESQPEQPLIPTQIEKPVEVIPASLNEAALDSPSFRASSLHFSEQVDAAEKWLDSAAKVASKFAYDFSSIESQTSQLLSQVTSSIDASQAVVDHDYTLAAMKRCNESGKEFWSGVVTMIRSAEPLIVEPIRSFTQGDLRNFKETRRIFEQSQKQYDSLQGRYASQVKTKEPSALREDAFQLHEARKAYLKASLDFSAQAPQFRTALDRLLVTMAFDQWRTMRVIHDNNAAILNRRTQEMERIKGWTHELESTEKSSHNQLISFRKEIEDATELSTRPSRELEDYSISTVPYLGPRGPSSFKAGTEHNFNTEKQGWLNLRTLTGKPTRTNWVRRWTFVKNGMFGCLVQNLRIGGVEESERIGVLLCSIRPASQEERRFCFEVKTTKSTILLQAETQKSLMEWIGSFEAAKRNALDSPTAEIYSGSAVPDPAFSITQPPAPEFTADVSDSLTPNMNEESSSLDRVSTISNDRDGKRSSGDMSGSRRSSTLIEPEQHRLRLDLHRMRNSHLSGSLPGTGPAGGIASLISASQSIFPIGGVDPDLKSRLRYNHRELVRSSLAPPTLATSPVLTNMSQAAVFVSSELWSGESEAFNDVGQISIGMMANLWGTSNWAVVNKLERREDLPVDDLDTQPPKPSHRVMPSRPSGPLHRQAMSLGDVASIKETQGFSQGKQADYYPSALKPHFAQFRLLFPNVPSDESVILVFRGTFSVNDRQDFPGRAYVTTRNIYFYSNHLGLVFMSRTNFGSISEVTAAPGRDCDFLFFHIIPERGSDIPGRITIKTFLEPLELLQQRLNYLINIPASDESPSIENIFNSLSNMENEYMKQPVGTGGGEESHYVSPTKAFTITGKPEEITKISGPITPNKAGRNETSYFKLPSQPVFYVPRGVRHIGAEKIFEVSAKALFHILFGDKSPVWQLLQYQRRATGIHQSMWHHENSTRLRRDFKFLVRYIDVIGFERAADVLDYQILEVMNDHLCYVVVDKRTPWHLPFKNHFRLVGKIVITHISKSRCKLAIFTAIDWLWKPHFIGGPIEKRAMADLEQDALDLVDLVSDEVRKIETHSGQTKRAIVMFGQVGEDSEGVQYIQPPSDSDLELRRPKRQTALVSILLDTILSSFENAITLIFMSSLGFVKWTWKTIQSNYVIIFILMLSILFNGMHSYFDVSGWWNERKAYNFMNRLEIRPNGIVDKAIYLKDIDDAIANETMLNGHNSSCFSQFEDANSPSNSDIWLSPPRSADPRTKTSVQRLRRTRQRLGSRRHDLIVALRVVNTIEKEAVEAEWEHWISEESQKCRLVQRLLNREENSHDPRFVDKKEDIRVWHEEYCMSCEEERRKMLTARRLSQRLMNSG